jgi:hypothetical protein
MADDKTTDTTVAQDTGNQDVQPVVVKDDAAFRSEVIDSIKSAQQAQDVDGVGKGTTIDAGDTGLLPGDVILPDLAGTDIPDAFSDAAEKAGMTPAEIVQFADAHANEELLELIPSLLAAVEPADDSADKADDAKDKTVVADKDTAEDDKEESKIDPATLDAITEKISKQLEEKFGATLKDIETFKASQEEQSTHKMVETVSKKFDEAFKEFPVFGKTEELPKFPFGKLAGQLIPTSPAAKARMEVLKYADAFMKVGANIDNAMDDALATYKGKHLGKELERKLIKGLKGHETKLSGARTGKETTKKYADTREEIIDEIRQMQKAAGLEP